MKVSFVVVFSVWIIKFADRCFELIHMPSSSSYIPSVLPLIFLISKIVAGVGMSCISSAILLPVIFACPGV